MAEIDWGALPTEAQLDSIAAITQMGRQVNNEAVRLLLAALQEEKQKYEAWDKLAGSTIAEQDDEIKRLKAEICSRCDECDRLQSVYEAAAAFVDFCRTDQRWVDAPKEVQAARMRASMGEFVAMRELFYQAVDAYRRHKGEGS